MPGTGLQDVGSSVTKPHEPLRYVAVFVLLGQVVSSFKLHPDLTSPNELRQFVVFVVFVPDASGDNR